MASTPDPVPIERRFAAADFFLLRSATLPIDRLEALGDAANTGAAPEVPNQALQAWVRDALVQAAIYLASPSLSERLTEWLRQPTEAAFDALRPALFRYFVRMTSRATPFGLFASTSLGRIGSGAFEIGARAALRRQTWLDLGYVYPLVARTVASHQARVALNYTLNSTLIRTDLGWRYMEEKIDQERRRRDLVNIQSSDILDAVLARARQAAGFDVLIDLIMNQAEVERDDATEYLHQVIDSQLLVPTLAPTLTGPDPLQHLIALSSESPALAPFHDGLQRAARSLQQIDQQAVESSRAAYREASEHLLGLLDGANEKYLFHVDLRREAAQLALPASVSTRVLRAVEALSRTTPPPWPAAALTEFRQRFTERYGDRDVPLMEVLDEDTGIGFEIDPGSRSNEHLLAEFNFGGADAPKAAGDERRTRHLIDLLERAWSQRQRQLTLTDADIEELAIENAAALPDLFTVFGNVASEHALREGNGDEPCFVLQSVLSGAGLFGRFCRADPELEQQLKALLRSEEALLPDAIFAELVHLPDDRVGNVVCRPALRAKDLPCLGQSGLALNDQITVADLTVTVKGERIVLRSRALGREILPRLTCAHNVAAPNASVYRFLAALAKQDGVSGLAFRWGSFANVRFLPRIVFGNVVLSPASWRVDKSTIAAWLNLSFDERQREISAWRAREDIPRWVQVGPGDNLLSLDLGNPWCVDSLADNLHRSRTNRVSELIPAPDNFPLRSPEGRHAHEVMIPFLRREPVRSLRPASKQLEEPADLRRFTPGSRWLYAKLYGSAQATEAVLAQELYPLIETWRADGSIDRWHFLRYRDSDDHLRVRFHGAAEVLGRVVQPALEQLFQRVARGSAIWRCQFDTYEREATRYGGPEAIDLAERIFDLDSETVVRLLRAVPSDAAPDWRWLLSAKFVDAYYEAFSLDLEGRERLGKRIEAGFRREFRVDADFEGQISQRFRKERALLDALFAGRDRFPQHLRWAQDIVEAFKDQLSSRADELRILAQQERLSSSLEGISVALAHMHVNRMMLANPREHELIIHAFLHRICRGRIARQKPKV